MTNYEKIKSMAIDEMAIFLSNIADCTDCPIQEYCTEHGKELHYPCPESLWHWLKSEVNENDG